ncbi:MAG: PH domain-containing protein [Verrucomicrobiales bacterium]|nr:PH domain-containing protein [Verrucomicrobiales bacterium]
MEDEYPIDDGIYVLKGGRRLGPFTVENLLDGLESGDFSEDDVCLRPGATDCERLREILDWEEEAEAAPDEEDEDDFEESGSEFGEDDFEDEAPEVDEEEEERTSHGRPTASPSRLASNRLLYAGHPSVLNYPLALGALVFGITGGIWVYRIDPNLTLAGLALAVAGLVRLSFVRFTHDYHIRPRRIEVTTGFIARSSREVRIEDIRSINVTCRGLLGLFGIGTVDFLTSGDTPEITFERIWAAQKIKKLVRKLQDTAE